MNLARWFRGPVADIDDEELAAEMATFRPAAAPAPKQSLLDRTATAVDRLLADARDTRSILIAEIEERKERLRQAELVIAAFEPVLVKIGDGYDAADDSAKSYDAAIAAKRERGDKHFKRPVQQAAE